jgi:haloalkane dehalogenase
MRHEPPSIPAWLARELPFERHLVDVGTPDAPLRMHVMTAGPADGMPIVMAHGNPTWGYLWRKVVAALHPETARVRVILPDLIGLGFSDKPRDAGAHSLARHRIWFGAFLDALARGELGPPTPRFTFVGQDWGAPIGLAAIRSRPASLAGLVLLNTSVSPPRAGFRPTAFHRFAHTRVVSDLAFRLGLFPQAFMNLTQGDRTSIGPAAWRAYVWPLLDPRTNVAPLALARMVPDTLAHPSIPELAEIHAFVAAFAGPAAIAWGQRDPVLGRILSWIEKTLPHAKVWRTEAGHFLQEEVPDVIAEGIRHVLQAR